MKNLLSGILILWLCCGCTLMGNALSIPLSDTSLSPVFDTVSPPPGYTDTISGPVSACIYDTSIYRVDLPLDCDAEWYVNGLLQESDSSLLTVTWTTADDFTISVSAGCDSNVIFLDSIDVMITAIPQVNLGNDTTIQEGTSLLLDAANEGSQYLWSTGDTSRTLLVNEAGEYWVRVSNDCGQDSDTIIVNLTVGLYPAKEENVIVIRQISNHLVVNIGDETIRRFSASDLSGKIISKTAGKNTLKLPRHGIYLLSITTERKTYLRKWAYF